MRHGRPDAVQGGRRFIAVGAAMGALLCAGGLTPARGQVPPAVGTPAYVLAGTVLDRESEGPVSSAQVYLLHLVSRAQLASAESDTLGAFALPPVQGGTYGLHIERIGYKPVDDSVTLAEGQDDLFTIYLVPEAIDLEPLVVRVPRTAAYYMRDFERRRATGNGTFITRAQIERRRASQTSDILHSLGGVRVMYGRQGEAALFVRGTCRPQIYIDGAAIHQGVSIDMAVLPDDIEGIEVYSNATIPAQYAAGGSCAAILVWTRPGVRVEAKKKASIWKVALVGGVLLTLFILGH